MCAKQENLGVEIQKLVQMVQNAQRRVPHIDDRRLIIPDQLRKHISILDFDIPDKLQKEYLYDKQTNRIYIDNQPNFNVEWIQDADVVNSFKAYKSTIDDRIECLHNYIVLGYKRITSQYDDLVYSGLHSLSQLFEGEPYTAICVYDSINTDIIKRYMHNVVHLRNTMFREIYLLNQSHAIQLEIFNNMLTEMYNIANA